MLYHGVSKSGAYKSYYSMKNRCLNERSSQYSYYGGRGITICERWLEKTNGLSNFINDMGERPKGKSLDRINNNEGYFAGNCRWATSRQQSNNRRSNVKVEFEGTIYNVCELCRKFNVNYLTVKDRVKRGWLLVDACTTATKVFSVNTSGYTGVSWSKSKKNWRATYGKKRITVCESVDKQTCIDNFEKWKIKNGIPLTYLTTGKPNNT